MGKDLQGRVSLVTGAGAGIGRAIAKALSENGAKVGAFDVNFKAAEETARIIVHAGGEAIAIEGDVASEKVVWDAVALVKEKFGPITILVNDAGISPKRNGMRVPFWEMEFSEWRSVIEVNLMGAWLCSRAVVEDMIAQKRGVIVTISSIAAKLHSELAGCHYHASKAGLLGLNMALAAELGPFGIRVMAIAPGRIRTEMAARTPAEINDRIIAHIPLGVWGEVEDVANLAVFLASDSAKHLTGEVIYLDGGWGIKMAY